MPRGPRLDAPGAVHHVIARGIERRNIFRSDADRRRFLDRLADLLGRFPADFYAWCLLSNHFHLLLRTGTTPLSSLLRRLLTGYAGSFNRTYCRAGHLFQNRFKSILVEEEPYLLELVRYIHLNPVRAGIIGIEELDRHPWTGHSVLLGRRSYPAQHTEVILAQFGSTPRTARLAYADFVRAGVRGLRGVDLEGGGLRRSLGGWERLVELRRGRERWSSDERILGGSSFVEKALAFAEQTLRRTQREGVAALPELLDRVAAMCTTSPALVASRCKRPEAVRARALFSFAAARGLGLPVGVVARHLGVSTQSVLRGLDAAGQLVEERRLTASDLLPDRSRGRAPRGS